MGQLVSREALPDVDLLPPKFVKPEHPLTRLQKSPFEYLFGAQKRQELLQSYYSTEGGISFRLGMKPDIDEKVDVSLQSATDAAYKVSSAQARLGYREDESNPVWQGTISGSTESGLTSTFSMFDVVHGFGAYTILPLEKLALIASPSARSVHHDDTVERDISEVEVGGRCVNPGRGLAAGVQLSPFSNAPTRLWMIGNYRKILTFGAQLHADFGKMQEGTDSRFRSNKQQAPLAPWWSPSMRALDMGLSFHQDLLYEMTVAIDGLNEELVAGYIHQMTVRRPVWNIFEDENVKGIYNYVDVGFELRRSIHPPYQSNVSVGASWQLNKNVLLKGKLGTNSTAVSLATKSWWDPEATVALTASYDREHKEPRFGVSFALEKGGNPEYRKAIRGYQQSAANRALQSRESINQRITPFTDPEPFRDIPRR
eukprot:gb/GECG01016333.1/.p1 GENE.gb/GECG01016333.1/~~gb/GECG01016333.1/.p1  ORF type:complete len:427 (+),score=31.97 gb/GECG01016333.1/:1-1281(+)